MTCDWSLSNKTPQTTKNPDPKMEYPRTAKNYTESLACKLSMFVGVENIENHFFNRNN